MPKKQRNKRKRIVLTGGHAATTAMATIEELIRRSSKANGWDIYWIGSKRAIEGKDVPTLESEFLPKLGVSFHPIFTGRLQIKFTVWTIPSIAKIPIGLFQSFFLLLKLKPDIVLSFGGFASFPVVLAAWFLRIPIVIHEQTTAAGRATRFSAPFAKKIALARKESKKYFPPQKTVVVGNPVMTQVVEVLPKEKPGSPPTIFVVGGSRGSQTINTLIEQIAEKLLAKYILIHQTGLLDYRKVLNLRKSLPEKLKERYEVYATIDPMDIDDVYRRADIIVSRAGANTVSELLIIRRPAILIPIPFSYADEQRKNAVFAQKWGIARVLEQEEITAEELLEEIEKVFKDWEKIVSRVKKKKSLDINASKKLVDLLEEIV